MQSPLSSEESPSSGVVYFVQAGGDGGPIKIGVSRPERVHRRVREIQCGNHLELRILGMVPGERRLEGHLHMLFGNQRMRGEWFSASPEMVGFIHDITEPVESDAA